MKTVLLLAGDSQVKPLLAEALGPHVNLVLVEPPADPSREQFDALFATWLRLADTVLVDVVSLRETARWALESLAAVKLGEHQSVVARLSAAQRSLYHAEPHWLVLADTDTPDQTRSQLRTFLDLREAQADLKRAHAALDRAGVSTAGATAPPVAACELLRYRDALRNIGHVLGKNLDQRALLKEFLHFLRELLGVGKLALLTRPYHNDLFTERLALEQRHLAIAASHGIAPDLVEHLRLSLDFGIGGRLERDARILRRAAPDHDPQAAREFELLGADVAVPMFDNDRLLGALTFSGKITGEALTNEEMEMVYHLLAQLGQAIRNLHLQAKIAGQQRFMSELLAHAQSGVVAVSEDDRLLCVNRRARELLELGDGNLVGQETRCLPPCVGDALFEVLQSGQEIWQREVTLAVNRRPLSVSATRFATSLGDGLALVAVALVEDLTQTKLQQAQSRELADKEFFTRLASRLSHELKNSLVSIKIHAQLLPERYDEREFREQFSRIVTHEVNRVDLLVNNLTFFSHPLALNYETIALEELLDAVIRNLAEEFGRKQLLQVVGFGQTAAAGDLPQVVVKKTLSGPPRFEADRVRLIQAFEHLLRNALQAMPKGGRLTISSAAAEGDAIQILWEDSGEGIALEQLPRVTEPFITTRNVGVGLGLTIVKRIIERHSGRFVIDSLLGNGTKITLLLPLKAQLHPEDQLAGSVTPAATPVPAKP
jgi:signal transduction histidine kinase